jgi:hypothetical protein
MVRQHLTLQPTSNNITQLYRHAEEETQLTRTMELGVVYLLVEVSQKFHFHIKVDGLIVLCTILHLSQRCYKCKNYSRKFKRILLRVKPDD